MTDDEKIAAIADRLRFFFGDANVRQDYFIRKGLLSDAKSLSIESLLKFNTIKQISTEPEHVKKAAETLPEALTVVNDGSAIGRVKEFTMDMMDGNLKLALIVGNIPLKEEDDRKLYAVTHEEVKKLFEEYGTVALTKWRFKGGTKGPRVPTGLALVEFETEETLQKAADDTLTTKESETVEPKRKLKLGDNELTVVTLSEYVTISKKRRGDKGDSTGAGDDDEDGGDQPTYTVDWKPGCVIKLEGLSGTCDREQMLEAVAKGLGIDVEGVKDKKIYMDFSRGQTDGNIRFNEPEPVAGLLSKLQSGEIEIAGAKVGSVSLLEGEVEKKYWDAFMAFKTRQMRDRKREKKARQNKKARHS